MFQPCSVCTAPGQTRMGQTCLCLSCQSIILQAQSEECTPCPVSFSSYVCQVHSRLAKSYCLCVQPNTYLCELCYEKHLASPGAHTIVRIGDEITSPEDAQRHNQKLDAAKSLRDSLRTLKTRLEEERQSAEAFLQQSWDYHQKVLQQTYFDLRNDVLARYEGLKITLDNIDIDIERTECRKDSDLGQDAALFINFGAHIASIEMLFIDLNEIIAKTIQMEILPQLCEDPPLTALLKSWNKLPGSFCTCATCEQYRVLFHLPSQQSWTCFNCNTSNVGQGHCKSCFCGKDWLDYLIYSEVRLNEDRSKWVCDCGGGNEIAEGRCRTCGRDNWKIINGQVMKGNRGTSLLHKLAAKMFRS